MEATFYVGTAFVLATAAVLTYVGVLQQGRAAGSPSDRAAIVAFAWWWYGAAAVLFLIGLQSLLVLAGIETLAVHNAIRYVRMVPLSVAVGSLLFFMLYLLTGKIVWRTLLKVGYGGFFLFTIYYAYLSEPVHLRVTAWDVRMTPQTPVPPALGILFGVLLAGPILFATIAYATLFFKVKDPTHRYRLALLALSFIVWFGAILIGFLLRWTGYDWFPLVYETPGILAGALVIMAYRPPQWIQRRLSARSAGQDVQTT